MGTNLRQLNKIVVDFNRKFPVGSEVFLRKDSGEVRTRVQRPAIILSGHSAVAFFEGVSGCYAIDGRVRAAALQSPRTCRVCGCTDDHACPGGCSWVEEDLCSACVERSNSVENSNHGHRKHH